MVHVTVVTQTLRHHSESPVLYQELLDQENVVRISGPIIFIWPILPLSTLCQQSQPLSTSDLLYKLVHIYPYLGEFKNWSSLFLSPNRASPKLQKHSQVR